MKQKWAEVLGIALFYTALHCTRLDCCWLVWTWAILDWNVLRWKGMNGIGRKWIDLNGTELDWAGRDGNRLHLMDWTGLNWTGVHISGVDWSGLSRTSFQKTKLDGIAPNWTRLSLPELDFTRLHYTHCTTLDWTGKYHTRQSVHCTSLDWSAPKCIPRFQMKLIKTVLHCTWMYSIGLDHTG